MSRYEDTNQRERGKKRGSKIGSVLSTILLIAAIGVFGYSAFTLYGYYKEYKAGTDEYGNLNDQFVEIQTSEPEQPETTEEGIILTNVEALEKDEPERESEVEKAAKADVVENGEQKRLPMLKNPINFEELQAINHEVIGWIRIGALDISYPVAQAADNDYYLHRTFERVDNFAGCIFLNCDNTRFFTDQNTIIYGHNMKNGSMFGKLSKFKEQDVYDSCPYFWIFTPDFIYQYRIFSCSTVNKMGDPYRTRFSTEDFQNYINNSQAGSAIDNHGTQVTTENRITTLSTCTGDASTRLIVQGKLVQIYSAVNS